jgi:hypothetical protein
MDEIVSQRTEHAKTFDIGDNYRQVIVNKSPVHYKNEHGMLLDIDTNLELDSDNNLIAYKLPYSFKLEKKGIGFSYTSKKLGKIKMQLVQIDDIIIQNQEYEFTFKNNIITFTNVVFNLDIIFRLNPTSVKTFRLLKGLNTPRQFVWKVECNEQTLKLISDDIIGFDNYSQKPRRKLELLVESQLDNNVKTITETWTGRVRTPNKETRIASWTDDPIFPVLIDPTITEEVPANADDVTELNNTTLSVSLLNLGLGSSSTYNMGIRFTSVPIPVGTTLTSGILKLNVTGYGGTTYGSGLIYGYDVDSAAQWTAAIRPSTVTKTSATTILPRPGTTGITSYNVTSVVQEIINRAGWALNNNIGFAIINQEIAENSTAFEDFNAAGTNEPLLELIYSDGTGTLCSGNIPLYIQGHALGSGEIPLYLHSPAPSGEIPLFIEGHALTSGEIPLFTMAGITVSGDLLPLYVEGHGVSSGTIPLFIEATPPSGSLDLYIWGHSISSGSIPLFIWAPTPDTASMNLYTLGGLEPGTQSSGNFPLFTWSTTNSGVLGAINLYLENTQNFLPENALNLVLGAVEYETLTGSMNLVAYQNTTVSGDALSLFLGNYYGGLSGNIPLFMSAPSGTLGATPLSGTMNLYIAREYEGNYGILPLFLDVAELESGSLPLYIAGETTSNNSLNLFMSGVHNPLSTLQLFTHGYG